ncbi:alpha/beta hydrolase [Marinicella gelatinilytica]|uniref:alpha/beta hydrolase n=1 Tax=Marinicella gelatinilytica TaxID=2996017 RepID=UPI002260EA4A|nr:dienelactone hydrolase family protein [Marinicella gelatinilytica]MCX7546133.1 dienelactone hydrolase family protein [Marinicella gelatinilytica]
MTTINMLEFITANTGDNPDYVIIWLHGLGADGHDFEPVVPQFNNPKHTFKFIFPHAPVQPVTINGGMAMRAWYDITAMDINRQVDEAGITTSAKQINKLIAEQIKHGFKAEQIVLAGFSQGGAMALHIALTGPHKLAAVIALSCYLPIPEVLNKSGIETNKTTPFFMAHGEHDPVVPYQLGHKSHQLLVDQGFTVNWHHYPIQHGVDMNELNDIKNFLLTLP